MLKGTTLEWDNAMKATIPALGAICLSGSSAIVFLEKM
jgi:hypothetical protein